CKHGLPSKNERLPPYLKRIARIDSDQAGRLNPLLASLGQRLHWLYLRPGVKCPRPDQPVVVKLLDDMSAPAGNARHHKNRRVQGNVEAEAVIKSARGPIEVGHQVLLALHRLFDDLGNALPLRVVRSLGEAAGVVPEDVGASVAGFVDAMAETHDALF